MARLIPADATWKDLAGIILKEAMTAAEEKTKNKRGGSLQPKVQAAVAAIKDGKGASLQKCSADAPRAE